MRRYRKFCPVGVGGGGGGGLRVYNIFLVINEFPREAIGPIEKQLDPSRNNWTHCFSRGSVPGFLRKPIATCDFPGGVQTPCSSSGSAHVIGWNESSIYLLIFLWVDFAIQFDIQ